MSRLAGILALSSFVGVGALAADKTPAKPAKEALQACNLLVGTWRGTGQPEGTLKEKQRGFWSESLTWEWQFKGEEAWLKLAIDKGKYYTGGELRYLADKEQYQLTMTNADKESVVFSGKLDDQKLVLEREDKKKKESQRVVITLLRANRFLYRYEVKSEKTSDFSKKYEVGATKEGVPFAGAADSTPECIVSGGQGTIKVAYKGVTYYVCCSGCRDEFKEDPEKYIKASEAKKGKEKK
jgi:YHS domain-containing protein